MLPFYIFYYKKKLLSKIPEYTEYQSDQLEDLECQMQSFRKNDKSVPHDFINLNPEPPTILNCTSSRTISNKHQADSLSMSSAGVVSLDWQSSLQAFLLSHLTISMIPQAGSLTSVKKKAFEWHKDN